jgi:hypothetical protein
VNHRPRRHGRSKFGASRFVNGFLDLMAVSFVQTSALKPLHVFGRAGLAFLGIGILIEVMFLVQWAMGEPLRVRPLLVLGGVLAILGIQLLSMGLLGEMIASQKSKTDFPIRSSRNWDEEEPIGPPAEVGSRRAAGLGE